DFGEISLNIVVVRRPQVGSFRHERKAPGRQVEWKLPLRFHRVVFQHEPQDEEIQHVIHVQMADNDAIQLTEIRMLAQFYECAWAEIEDDSCSVDIQQVAAASLAGTDSGCGASEYGELVHLLSSTVSIG